LSVDRITLTIPRTGSFHGVAHLVLGGLAVRLNLTLEALQELELALDGLLEVNEPYGDVTLEVCMRDGGLETTVGPFEPAALHAQLDGDGTGLNLRRVLETVSDDMTVDERNGHQWVQLVKRVAQ
jgi:hypothetical protein